ncbi:oxidoreductase [Exophiala viscosa]|uniref:oxidoreductase n=1 Tax=Exophiala viscosa TaxID=2486360 RepID=UPI00218E43EC|nr:oxidoreductase [Exophiala viscosa]
MSTNRVYKLDGTGRLHGRIAIVTGSSSGLGREIALAIAREGASVVCSDLREAARPDGFEEDKEIPTHEVIKNNGGRAVFKKCDLSHTSEIVAVIQFAVETWGKLDILVNNAGLWMPLRDFVEESEEQWDAMFAINAKGTRTAMQEAIKQYLRQPIDEISGSRGRIVSISSAAGGRTAIRREATYAASKAAVAMLTQNVALDHAKDYININGVCPGVVKSGAAGINFRTPEIITEMRKTTPWPRLGEPSDIAKAVVFLCSDDAQWITGQNLAVDGGFTIGIPL